MTPGARPGAGWCSTGSPAAADLGGHAVGNVLIVALWELLGDTVQGLDWVGRLLGAHGRVLPMASVPLDLVAEVEGADPGRPGELSIVRGQAACASTTGRVRSISLHPGRPARLSRGGGRHPRRGLGGPRARLLVHQRPAPSARPRAGRRADHHPGAPPGGAEPGPAAGRDRGILTAHPPGSARRPRAGAYRGHRAGRPGCGGRVSGTNWRRRPACWAAGWSWRTWRCGTVRRVTIRGSWRGRSRRSSRGSEPMAMTGLVKDELSRVTVLKPCCRKAEVSTLLRFAGGLHLAGGRIVVEAELDTGAAARRLRKDVAEVFGHSSELIVLAPSGLRKGNRYLVRVRKDGDSLARQTGLVDGYGRPGPRPAAAGGGRDHLRLRSGLAGRLPGPRQPDRARAVDGAGDHLSRPRGRPRPGRGGPAAEDPRQGPRGPRGGPGGGTGRGRDQRAADPAGRARQRARLGGTADAARGPGDGEPAGQLRRRQPAPQREGRGRGRAHGWSERWRSWAATRRST